MNSGIKAYNQVAVHTGVNDASPHRLIQMLLEAALEKIAKAKGFMANKKIQQKGENISLAISIIDVLRASLDMQAGGEISKNLEALYDYMVRRLTEANLKNDLALLDEITNLILPIKQAWDAIPEDVREAHQQQQLREQSKEQAAAG
jgi:flagellar protein FliS